MLITSLGEYYNFYGEVHCMLYKLKENRVYRTYLGGKHIDMFYGKESCYDSFFPEDWTASVVRAFNPGRENISEGEGITEDGWFIKELITGEMKCLVKLLDSAERLVIQVHPTVEFAKEYFKSKFGKTECWYFLDCADNAYVYLGFREGITKEKWISAVYAQDIEGMLSMLNKLPVKSGDCLFVAGGVPHAIGEGCFMIEVQEPSDLMGVVEKKTPSGRELADVKLHGGIGFENMLKMFDYNGMGIDEIKKSYSHEPKMIRQNVFEIIGKSTTDKFSIYLICGEGEYTPQNKNGVVIITKGSGSINGIKVKKGDRMFFNEGDTISTIGNLNAVVCF